MPLIAAALSSARQLLGIKRFLTTKAFHLPQEVHRAQRKDTIKLNDCVLSLVGITSSTPEAIKVLMHCLAAGYPRFWQ